MATRTRRKNKLLQERIVLSVNFPGAGFTAAVKATGTILCAADAAAADGDTVTVGDGIRTPVVFEYDKSSNGVSGGHTSWAAGTTAASNATALRLLILAAFPDLSVVDNLAGLLTITNNIPGTAGNVTILHSGAVTTTVTGMSGGLAEVATAITATTTQKFHKCAHPFLVESAELYDLTGLVQDAANYFTITLQKGSTVMATWSTLTGQEGTLTADTFKTMTKSAVSGALTAAKDDVLALVMTLTGTQTLPAGRLVVHGRYL